MQVENLTERAKELLTSETGIRAKVCNTQATQVRQHPGHISQATPRTHKSGNIQDTKESGKRNTQNTQTVKQHLGNTMVM